MPRIVVERITGGPIRAVLEVEQDRLEMFSARERNALLARSLERAMTAWRNVYLRRRFQREVLDAPFEYRGPRSSPMVDTAEMSHQAYTGQVIARAPGGRVSGTVSIPYGHAVTKEISRVWRILPAEEMKYVAKVFAKAVAHELATSEEVVLQRPRLESKPRRRLTIEQRQRFNLRDRKPRAAKVPA
jgi:hypothetical protein